jgi:hypothetical protein
MPTRKGTSVQSWKGATAIVRRALLAAKDGVEAPASSKISTDRALACTSWPSRPYSEAHDLERSSKRQKGAPGTSAGESFFHRRCHDSPIEPSLEGRRKPKGIPCGHLACSPRSSR